MLSRRIREDQKFSDRAGFDQLKAHCDDLESCLDTEKKMEVWCAKNFSKEKCKVKVDSAKDMFCKEDTNHVYCNQTTTVKTTTKPRTTTTETTTIGTTTLASDLPLIIGCAGAGFFLALVVLCVLLKCILSRRQRGDAESGVEKKMKKKKKKKSRTQRSSTSYSSTGRSTARKSTFDSTN